MENVRLLLALCAFLFLISACETTPDPPDPQQQLVERGRDIFFGVYPGFATGSTPIGRAA